ARPDLAVGAPKALKGRLLLNGDNVLEPGVLAEMIVARELLHRAIVLMHPLAWRDRTGGETDDLPEFANRRAWFDRDDRHFVALGHAFASPHATRGFGTGGNFVDRDDHVVRRVEAQSAGRRHDYLPLGLR